MSLIEWNAKYEVGDYEIDSAHKIFVKIIQKLNTANSRGDRQLVELLFVELLKYAEYHFCSEENIMLINKYPDLLNHKKEHEKLLAELRNRVFSLKYEYIDYDKLEKFLLGWFTKHTSAEDLKLASFLRNQETRH